MKFFNFLFITIFPIFCYADGVSVSQYTLESVKVALLVKVLAYNANKYTAKVKVLNKFSKQAANSSAETNFEEADKEIAVANIQDLQIGQIANVQIKKPSQAMAGKWVIEKAYWHKASEIKIDEELVLLGGQYGNEFTSAGSPNLEKLEVFFDPKKLQNKMTSETEAGLKEIINDLDYQDIVITELFNRNAIGLTYLSTIEDSILLQKLIQKKISNIPTAAQNNFFIDLAKTINNSSLKSQTEFLTYILNSSEASLDLKIQIFEIFDQKKLEISEKTHTLFYAINSKVAAGELTTLNKSVHLLLDYVKNVKKIPSGVNLEIFFQNLKSPQKDDFLLKFSDLMITLNDERLNSDIYRIIYNEFKKNPNWNLAWSLSKIDYNKIRSGSSDEQFNDVVNVLLKNSANKTPEVKAELFKFIDKYTNDSDYPLNMNVENSHLFKKMGGILYSELSNIRLTTQTNLDQLAAKFTYYFETAIFVEIIKIDKAKKWNTVQLNIRKSLGTLKNPESTNSKLLKFYKEAAETKNLLATVSNETLDLIEKLPSKNIIIAGNSTSNEFLVFDISFEKQIEKFF